MEKGRMKTLERFLAKLDMSVARLPNFNLCNEVIRVLSKPEFEGMDDDVGIRLEILLIRWETFSGAGLLKEDSQLVEDIFEEVFGWKFNGGKLSALDRE
jgi:hypothetical protein